MASLLSLSGETFTKRAAAEMLFSCRRASQGRPAPDHPTGSVAGREYVSPIPERVLVLGFVKGQATAPALFDVHIPFCSPAVSSASLTLDVRALPASVVAMPQPMPPLGRGLA